MNEEAKRDDNVQSRVPALGRRDLMKIGAGVVMTTLAPSVTAQEPATDGSGAQARGVRPAGLTSKTGPGFRYTANRLSGNGPMDETTRRAVSFALSYSEAQMTEATITGLNKLTIDTGAPGSLDSIPNPAERWPEWRSCTRRANSRARFWVTA